MMTDTMNAQIKSIYQYAIKKSDLEDIHNDRPRPERFSLRRIAKAYNYWGTKFYDSRLTASGWYIFELEDDEEKSPDEPETYKEDIRYPDMTVDLFDIYRCYGRSRGINRRRMLYDQWKYFTFQQKISVGDIILKNKNYHKINGIYVDPHSNKAIVLEVESLVTGSVGKVKFSKLPKMKVYDLSDNQLKNIQRKSRKMKKKVQSALNSTKVKLVPRNRLGAQSKFARNKLEDPTK